MRNTLKNIILFSAIFLLSTGCKEKNLATSEGQRILFQFEYINYAWSYQHSGFYIDNEGHIFTYSNPEKWNFVDSNQTITHDRIAENLSYTSQSSYQIPYQDLQKFAGYIDNIAASEITALKQTAADAGSIQYFCYRLSGNSIYKLSLIKMEGDFTCENLNFYTKKVVGWMKELNDSIIEK